MKTFVTVTLAVAACAILVTTIQSRTPSPEGTTMELGAFSISLAVKDLDASRAFYEKLGFEQAGGDAAQNWLVLRHGTTTVGLFQGMFEQNVMTFNPGWSANAEPLETFTDVREIQRTLKSRGLEITTEADETTTGPASFVLTDPDGNPIYVDQHVPKPE